MTELQSLMYEIDQLCGLIGTEVHGRLVRGLEKVESRIQELKEELKEERAARQ